MALPKLTDEQRAAALEKARRTREMRSAAMNDLAEGKITPADFIAKDDPVYSRVKVSTFLKRLPRVGNAKAEQAMAICSIPEDRRLSGLGAKQKEALLAWISDNVA